MMYSHTRSTLYFSCADTGTMGALSAMVPWIKPWMTSFCASATASATRSILFCEAEQVQDNQVRGEGQQWKGKVTKQSEAGRLLPELILIFCTSNRVERHKAGTGLSAQFQRQSEMWSDGCLD